MSSSLLECTPAARGYRASILVLLAGMLAVTAIVGCESTPARTLRGARLYAAGTAALDQGDSPRAIQELEAAARLVPQASEIQNHLGLAYWADGRPGDAEIAFEKALGLDCDNLAARENLERLRLSASSDPPRPSATDHERGIGADPGPSSRGTNDGG